MLDEKSNTFEEFDYLIIGSGFGGSVSALRLSEKGYKVAVVEQGRRLSDKDLEEAGEKATKLNWLPKLGMKGFLSQYVFKHITLVY